MFARVCVCRCVCAPSLLWCPSVTMHNGVYDEQLAIQGQVTEWFVVRNVCEHTHTHTHTHTHMRTQAANHSSGFLVSAWPYSFNEYHKRTEQPSLHKSNIPNPSPGSGQREDREREREREREIERESEKRG